MPVPLTLVPLVACCFFSGAPPAGLSGDAILAKAAERNAQQHASLPEYSGLRSYRVKNLRFGMKETTAVRSSYVPGAGQKFTVLERNGSEELSRVLDRVLAAEEDSSRPSESGRHEFTPENYEARVLGTASKNSTNCYVLELRPKQKSKYLLVGKIWIDTRTFAIVHVEGRAAARVSLFLGRPFLTEDFAEVDGFWLPVHAGATSTTLLLGESELQIDYRDYQLSPVASGSRPSAVR